MRHLLAGILVMSLAACAQLEPKTLTSLELPVQGQLIFKASVDQTFEATKQVFTEEGWKLLYEGSELPKKEYAYFSNRDPDGGKSYDRAAWGKTIGGSMPPKKYLEAKTATSAFSFGAELFVTLFEAPNQGCVVAITASSGQALEKDKLETYINSFTTRLNQKVK
jgi:uncharacterized lipoprotein YmbA